MKIVKIKPSEIKIGERLRKDLGDVETLSKSIKKFGLLQFIGVNSKKQLIFGERRLSAWKTTHGDKPIPTIQVEEVLTELIENLVRENFPWQDEVKAITTIDQKMREEYGSAEKYSHPKAILDSNNGWTQEQTAELLAISQPSISIAVELTKAMESEPKIAKARTKEEALAMWARIKKIEETLDKRGSEKSIWDRQPVPYIDGSRIYFISEKTEAYKNYTLIENGEKLPTVARRRWFYHSVIPTVEFSLGEYASAQGLPRDYKFVGSSKEIIRERIGEMVPPQMAKAAAEKLNIPPTEFADLFCGYGGMSLGFEWAGHKSSFACDNDPHCVWTYKLNFPHAKVDERPIQEISPPIKVDLVIGGPPCQGFSVAGHNFVNDPRNSLYKEFMRFVGESNAKFFVMENVPQIEKFKEPITAHMSNLGFKTEWLKINGLDVDLNQSRIRIFIIGERRSMKL